MDWEMLTPFFAYLVLIVGLGYTLWIYWVAVTQPTQWLTPVDKVIVITGCDSGIGYQLAKHFHEKGSIVIATVLSESSEGARKLSAQLKGDRFHLIQLNLKSSEDIAQTAQRIGKVLEERKQNLHALVNNAGICVFSEFDFCTTAQIEDQITVNLLGTIRLTRELLPLLIKGKGRIVNVSSVNAMQVFPGVSIYAATKKAIEAFGDGLRMELQKFGVQVVTVRLGDYARLTDIMSKHQTVMNEQLAQSMDSDKLARYGDYFERFHRSALTNYGYFSPPSFKESSLFTDFEEAVLANIPHSYIVSATWSYKALIYFLISLPITYSDALIGRFTKSLMEDSSEKNKKKV